MTFLLHACSMPYGIFGTVLHVEHQSRLQHHLHELMHFWCKCIVNDVGSDQPARIFE